MRTAYQADYIWDKLLVQDPVLPNLIYHLWLKDSPESIQNLIGPLSPHIQNNPEGAICLWLQILDMQEVNVHVRVHFNKQ